MHMKGILNYENYEEVVLVDFNAFPVSYIIFAPLLWDFVGVELFQHYFAMTAG